MAVLDDDLGYPNQHDATPQTNSNHRNCCLDRLARVFRRSLHKTQEHHAASRARNVNITDDDTVDSNSLLGKGWRPIAAAGYFTTAVSLFAASAMDHPYRLGLLSVGILFFVVGTALVVQTYFRTREQE